MRHHGFTILGLSALASIVGAMTLADRAFGDPNTAEMATMAKVSVNEAVKIASEQMSGTIFETELRKKHDKLVWEVKQVTLENKVLEVHIDAETGIVIDVKEGAAKSKFESGNTEQFRKRDVRFPYGLCS